MDKASPRTRYQRWRSREPNPVLIKELRGRMRGARAFVVLTAYLLLLSCFASVIYLSAYSATTYSTFGGVVEMADMGYAVFAGVVLIQIFLVTFITPAFTAGAITGERERTTYELLRTTLLPARRLVFGKLTSALTYMLLLILAAIPLEGLAFMLGGVVIEELALALVILMVTMLFFATLGLLVSALLRTTLASTVTTYSLALLMTIGLPIILIIFFSLVGDPLISGYGPITIPAFGQVVLFYLLYLLINTNPIAAALITKVIMVEENSLWYYWMDLASARVPVPSAWIVYAIFFTGLSLVLLLLTVLRVRRQQVQ